MQDPANELLRIPLLRSWVNRLISRQKCKNITNLAHLSDTLCPRVYGEVCRLGAG
jgi:hypothetical protein